ncbi:Acetolactate synthase isozyme 2 large subunit [Hartmannibacter diazotrophicus]|uniref:Acetolactate synthase isozyme 2 large subunit n=1 Tax=Hartmannibacter diazotrophicus TaxID=1482074 RepID=A0A2C9D2Q0_9HYPH|nr:thiamine pyrophosphate-binding protein [Hartmannibacter diazotrophicus]SON54503.1 Acetolactate synthase isozyme 2 large subunit [Hartmannibacter diazotrophicus]
MTSPTFTVARRIVEILEHQGVQRIFCVPGESYLPVLDALYDSSVETVVCRQEGGAAMMAEATGKLTGRPGIAFVTRGPGVTNASAGLHVAAQDSTPMILFVGQIERGMKEREAFQEIDYKAVFGSIAKWVVELDDAARVDELIGRAFQVAMNGRPGPVVVALPEDVLTEGAMPVPYRPREPVATNPGLNLMIQLQKKLWAAERPIAILGGSGWSEAAVTAFRRFAERFDLPVTCSFRRQMLFDHSHPNYVGDVGIGANPALIARIKASDLVLLVGGRMSEMPSQSYSLFDIPEPKQFLVHVHADAEELGRVYHAGLAINATPSGFAAAAEGLQPPNEIRWEDETKAARADYHAWSDDLPETPGEVKMGAVMAHLRKTLPPEAILTNGAGNYATWVHRFWRFRQFGTQLAPTSGSMGYGLPAAVAAKLERPDAPVVCFAGDGCFQMTGQEFGTAVQFGANIVVLVVDNGIYGTIRMHQEREFPGRVSGTELHNPDFAALARAYGGHGETVRTTDDFAPALERAMAAGKPALIHLLTDPEAITPTTTIAKLRAASKA